MNSENIVKTARTWANTPWMHAQRKKGIGVDCINFLAEVAKESGYSIPLIPQSYARLASKNQVEMFLDALFDRVDIKDIDKGDILLFRFAGYNNHVAIATSKTTIIHASLKDKKVIEHGYDGVWKRCTVAAWRLHK